MKLKVDIISTVRVTYYLYLMVYLRFCSICMMCCLIMGKMIFPPRPQAIRSRALSPATALLVGNKEQSTQYTQHWYVLSFIAV